MPAASYAETASAFVVLAAQPVQIVHALVICEVLTAAVARPRGVASGFVSASAASFVVDTGDTNITAENTSFIGSLLDNKVFTSLSDEIFGTYVRASSG
ncbi:MAG: hypothetical protein ACREC0_00675 [Methylocella sp.]